jgi:hypothetical protein
MSSPFQPTNEVDISIPDSKNLGWIGSPEAASFQFNFSKIQGVSLTGEMVAHSQQIARAVSVFLPDICNIVTIYCMCRVADRIEFQGENLVDFSIIDHSAGCCDRCFTMGHTSFLLTTPNHIFGYILNPADNVDGKESCLGGHRIKKSVLRLSDEQKQAMRGDLGSVLYFPFPHKNGKVEKGVVHGFVAASSSVFLFYQSWKLKRRIKMAQGESFSVFGFDRKSGYLFYRSEILSEFVEIIVMDVNDPDNPETLVTVIERDIALVTYDPSSSQFIILNTMEIYTVPWDPSVRPHIDLRRYRDGIDIDSQIPNWAMRFTAIEAYPKKTSDDKIDIFVAIQKSTIESVICILRLDKDSKNDKENRGRVDKKVSFSEPFYSQQRPMYSLRFDSVRGILYVLGDSMNELVAIVPPDDPFQKTEWG